MGQILLNYTYIMLTSNIRRCGNFCKTISIELIILLMLMEWLLLLLLLELLVLHLLNLLWRSIILQISSICALHSFLLSFLEIVIYFVAKGEKYSLYRFRHHLHSIFDVPSGQLKSNFLQYLLIESVPVVCLLLYRMSIAVIMQLNHV